MKKLVCLLMVGLAFAILNVSTVAAQTQGSEFCADPTNAGIGECPAANAGIGNADGTSMAPPADCGGVPCPTGHDGGPNGHHLIY